MTLFGRTLGAEEIAAIVFSLMALVLWFGALRGELRWARFFRQWEADRKARREAELRAEGRDPAAPDAAPGERGGPWG